MTPGNTVEESEDSRVMAQFAYLHTRRLGRGAEGRVYAAYDSERNIDVAVKIADSRREDHYASPVRPGLESTLKTAIPIWKHNPEWPKRLLQEYKALREGGDHPNLLRVLKEHGSDEQLESEKSNRFSYMAHYKCALFSMELCMGNVASQLYPYPPSVGLRTRVEWCRQLMEGVNALHKRKQSHRDIKPHNLLIVVIDNDLTSIRIGDFGLSLRIRDVPHDADAKIDMGGTSYYMAPELWSNEEFYRNIEPSQASTSPSAEELDRLLMATDQYAVAITIFEILSGQLPKPLQEIRNIRNLRAERDDLCKGKHIQGLAHSEISLRLPELSNRCFTRIDEILRTMLQRNPGRRFPSMADCSDAFERALIFEGLRG